jgi:pre-mRNA-splicing factor ATP-dependent RNA helicase DHX38/PRP16
MAQFPLDPPLSKMLITAYELGCSSEIMTIVSMLSVPSIFFRPKDRAEESDAAREKFFTPESDHLTMLNVYQQWTNNGFSAKWCGDHFVHQKSLKKVREVRGQLEEILQQQKITPTSCGTDWDVIRKAICAGYFHNAGKLRGIGEYVNLRTRIPAQLHPTSALYGLGYTPDYVVYHEVMYTTKEYMNTVTAVEPYWLAELGPMFFSVKESGSDIHTRMRQEAETKRKMEYEQKMRDDLDRQLQQEEAEKLVTGGGRVTQVGGKRLKKERSKLAEELIAQAEAGEEGTDAGAEPKAGKGAKTGGDSEDAEDHKRKLRRKASGGVRRGGSWTMAAG